jgi:hypothetical protein
VKHVVAFGRFWWSFVIGDDWIVAAGVGIVLGVTALLAHDDVTAWWLPPIAVVVLLGVSLRRATKNS